MMYPRSVKTVQLLRWAAPTAAAAASIIIMILDYNLSASAGTRMWILGTASACSITALIFGWSLQTQPVITPIEEWQQPSQDGKHTLKIALIVRGPEEAKPNNDDSAAYRRWRLEVVDRALPDVNVLRLASDAALKDATIERQQRMIDRLMGVPAPAELLPEPEVRSKSVRPLPEAAAADKSTCELCEHTGRELELVQGARRKATDPPADMYVCPKCIETATVSMGGTRSGATDASLNNKSEAATSEAVETS